MCRSLKIWLAMLLIGFFGFILISPINIQQSLAKNASDTILTKDPQQLEQKIASFEKIRSQRHSSRIGRTG